MTTMETNVKVGGLIVTVKVECADGHIGWAKDCAKKLREAVDALEKEFDERGEER